MREKARIARIAGLIIALLGTVSGEAMRLRGEEESRRSNDALRVSSPVSVHADEIEYRIVGDEAKACRYTGGKRNVSVSSCVFVPVYGRCCPVTGVAENCFRNTPVGGIVIPRTVQILGLNCFGGCWLLENISFEVDSQLKRIESRAFWETFLKSVTIPRDVEILGSSCFSVCGSLESVSFETDSRLKRIESRAFYRSSLESITIPRNVEALGSECFGECRFLRSISFEPDSQLRRIESKAFYFIRLDSITIPRNVEILGSRCFSMCCSLKSVSFETDSQLVCIKSRAFERTRLGKIVLPKSVKILGTGCFCGSGCKGRCVMIRFEKGSQLKSVGNGVFALSQRWESREGLAFYRWNDQPRKYILPGGVEEIGLFPGCKDIIFKRNSENLKTLIVGCHFKDEFLRNHQPYSFSAPAWQFDSFWEEIKRAAPTTHINGIPILDCFKNKRDSLITIRLEEDRGSLSGEDWLQKLNNTLLAFPVDA
ncbi:MAG: leucine-rich repeat domain-containing protein [Holosporales bacterium]|jgi:hypothetical protein|nr:leucine-rich repeat domain-containing protein [Holosporales bacterium]